MLLKAAELNPRDLWLQGRLAMFTLVPLGRYAEAMEVCDRAIVLGPDQRGLYDTKAGIYWIWKGDTEEARKALEALPSVGPFSQMMDFYQEVYERNYRAALERVSTMEGEWVEGSVLGRWPRSLLAARVYDLLQEPDLAASAYATALGLAEDDLRRSPDDPEIHAMLGLIHAGLGRKEEAVRAGKRAVELRPTARDAVEGPTYLRYLALIYARVGEHEAAIDELDRLFSIPYFLNSVPLLDLEPWWDPLRAHPRYKELVEKHAMNTERAPIAGLGRDAHTAHRPAGPEGADEAVAEVLVVGRGHLRARRVGKQDSHNGKDEETGHRSKHGGRTSGASWERIGPE